MRANGVVAGWAEPEPRDTWTIGAESGAPDDREIALAFERLVLRREAEVPDDRRRGRPRYLEQSLRAWPDRATVNLTARSGHNQHWTAWTALLDASAWTACRYC